MVMVQICDNAPSSGVQLSAGSAEAGGAAVPLADTHHVGDNAGVPKPCPRASLSVHFNDVVEYVEFPLPNFPKLELADRVEGFPWPSPCFPLAFVDIQGEELSVAWSVSNHAEASLATFIVKHLLLVWEDMDSRDCSYHTIRGTENIDQLAFEQTDFGRCGRSQYRWLSGS